MIMRPFGAVLAGAAALLCAQFVSLAGEPPHEAPAPGKPWEPAWGFYPKYPAAWDANHKKNLERAQKGGVDIIFYGDSITKGWTDKGKGSEVFAREYAPLKGVNFGIGGDATRQILWRMENGEVEGLSPKLVVLMIGTNNLYSDFNAGKDEEIAKGIQEVVAALRKKLPGAKILLLGILPRQNEYFCGRIKRINEAISKLDDGKSVRYLDMGTSFQAGFGKVKPELYISDQLHLSEKGYELWAETMDPLFREMLGLPARKPAPAAKAEAKEPSPSSSSVQAVSPSGEIAIFDGALKPGWAIVQWGGMAAAPSPGAGEDSSRQLLKLGLGKSPQPWAGAVLTTEAASVAGGNAPALPAAMKSGGALVFRVNGLEDEWGNHCGEQSVQVMLGKRSGGQGKWESGGYHGMGQYIEGGSIDKDPQTWQRVSIPLSTLLKNKDSVDCVGAVGFQYVGTPPAAGIVVDSIRIEPGQ